MNEGDASQCYWSVLHAPKPTPLRNSLLTQLGAGQANIDKSGSESIRFGLLGVLEVGYSGNRRFHNEGFTVVDILLNQ
ncbi:hypothetical protein MAH1_21180 [Sessilibacter sp. MAH1]